MPRKEHAEEKIIYALRQAEAGKKVGEIRREMGVSPQAYYSWKLSTRGWECCPGIRCQPPNLRFVAAPEIRNHDALDHSGGRGFGPHRPPHKIRNYKIDLPRYATAGG